MRRFESLPHLPALFARGGVREADYPAIHTAVVHHCLPLELDRNHPHWRLTSQLKDADGLDRVRLGDLDSRYLRNGEAGPIAAFAADLFERTDGIVPNGAGHFSALWAQAAQIAPAPATG